MLFQPSCAPFGYPACGCKFAAKRTGAFPGREKTGKRLRSQLQLLSCDRINARFFPCLPFILQSLLRILIYNELAGFISMNGLSEFRVVSAFPRPCPEKFVLLPGYRLCAAHLLRVEETACKLPSLRRGPFPCAYLRGVERSVAPLREKTTSCLRSETSGSFPPLQKIGFSAVSGFWGRRQSRVSLEALCIGGPGPEDGCKQKKACPNRERDSDGPVWKGNYLCGVCVAYHAACAAIS